MGTIAWYQVHLTISQCNKPHCNCCCLGFGWGLGFPAETEEEGGGEGERGGELQDTQGEQGVSFILCNSVKYRYLKIENREEFYANFMQASA